MVFTSSFLQTSSLLQVQIQARLARLCRRDFLLHKYLLFISDICNRWFYSKWLEFVSPDATGPIYISLDSLQKMLQKSKNKPFLLGSFCTIWMFLFIGNCHLFQPCRELRSAEILSNLWTSKFLSELVKTAGWLTGPLPIFFCWLFELEMLARTYLESSPSCHHWQCEFPTSKQKSELSKSSQKTSRCCRQHVRISTCHAYNFVCYPYLILII